MQHVTHRYSPYQVLQEYAASRSDTEALVLNDLIITYAEVLERVSRLAGWLVHQGFEPGEVTGLCIRDEIQHVISAMTLLCMSTPHICLGSHEPSATKRVLAAKVGVTRLIVDKPEDWMEGLKTYAPFNDSAAIFNAPAEDTKLLSAGCSLQSVALYQNTSGSTAVPRTFGFTLERIKMLSERYANDAKERRTLRTGSIEFDAQRVNRICTLLAGNTAVFLRDLNLRNLVSLCEKARISMIHIGAYKLTSLVDALGTTCPKLPSFTNIQTGGSRVSGRLRKDVQRALTKKLWVLYATSEIGTISMASPDQHQEFPEGVGFPSQNVEVEIIGDGDEKIPAGEIGQIRVRKMGMVAGYVGDPAAETSFHDGWFYPRDLVSVKDREPLIFHGRADDVMILNGVNIFPSPIEDVLESHPDVKEAVAYPIKSRLHGEIPVAAVVLKDGITVRDTSCLLDLCRCALGIRAPRHIIVVDRIPRNYAGKPLRRELVAP
jgi:acyl-CoA synthetase (AMP-forming)/AMP-acid ligase II